MMLSANNAWRERNPRPTMNFIQKNWKGILVCLVMAVPCWLLGQRFPIVGGPVFGILAGMIVTLLWHDKSAAQPGISFVSKVAPPQYQGIMQGAWLGATAVGNQLLFIGAIFYETIPIWMTWGVFVAVCLISMTVMFAMLRWLNRITK